MKTGTLLALAMAALLAACTSIPDAAPLPSVAALEAESEGPFELTAALLSAAEEAPDDATRAPYVARLGTMGVRASEDATDDPLAAWRSAMTADGTSPYRGRTLGPAYRRLRLKPGESMAMAQVFYAGEKAEIAAQASRGALVEMAISNRELKQVCTRQVSPQAKCLWLPRFTERFEITLTNRGKKPASVYVVFR